MPVPWGETTRPADTAIYDIPQTPPVPTQLDPPGWRWENAGTAGPIPMGAPYTIVETSDMLNYFNHATYPASAAQYRGQAQGPT